eukprot:TRINITY_DN10488_c2_g2_i2.p3 TRINITY_DN10488_c2_g2~~TRINITY_DN10488_c2_g2_i2.p3  ORF type:complete len:105 (+),score=33.16 TRINITY_DN10488_c2_g2_i2:306-620(+)
MATTTATTETAIATTAIAAAVPTAIATTAATTAATAATTTTTTTTTAATTDTIATMLQRLVGNFLADLSRREPAVICPEGKTQRLFCLADQNASNFSNFACVSP